MGARKWIALLVAIALLLTGCSEWNLEQLLGDIGAQIATPFSNMVYTRPDMHALDNACNICCESAKTETDVSVLLDKIWDFYGLYNSFYTNYNLANIHYFQDMTDLYWDEEYHFCARNAGSVEAALESLLYTLSACPLKNELEQSESFGEGFFDSYVGDILWDETFTDLMQQEAALEEKYDSLYTQAQADIAYSDEFFDGYGKQMGQIYVQLVALRQKIATYCGYEDYPSFAYDFYYYRDYTPAESSLYFAQIQEELVPLYQQIERRRMDYGQTFCSPAETFTYLQRSAEAMGGTVRNAFTLLETAQLYDLTYSDKKYDGSFELYLPGYGVPYVFVNPTVTCQDKLTFAHEFGHFCHDYVAHGVVSSVDVAEIFSQAMEYLSLCYADASQALTQTKLLDCLRIFVEQTAYASFEQQVYQLKGAQLTLENVYALYEQIGAEFGFSVWNWDYRDFVLIGHFFTEPLYLVSYVVSNDAALQIYQLELQNKGAGLALFEQELSTDKVFFLEFIQAASLKSPFVTGRIEEIKKILENSLL